MHSSGNARKFKHTSQPLIQISKLLQAPSSIGATPAYSYGCTYFKKPQKLSKDLVYGFNQGCGLCRHVWLIWRLGSGANQARSSCPLRNCKDNPGTWCMYSMMKSTCAMITAVHMASIRFPQHSDFRFRCRLGQSACLFWKTAKTFKGPGAWIPSMDVESN